MNDLLMDPSKGCFLCNPEQWRVLFSGKYNRIIAGVGPLLEGYCLVAPKHHISTVAELPSHIKNEFIALTLILKKIFEHIYSDGFTAYEHARIGICNFEERESCHHAHRVFIPKRSEAELIINSFFHKSDHINNDFQISDFSKADYVYYESGSVMSDTKRILYRQPKEKLLPQFMRQILVKHLSLPVNWNWACDTNFELMIRTVCSLKYEFSAIFHHDIKPINISQKIEINSNIFIDGFTCVGKSTIASHLKTILNVSTIDTGHIFRFIAYMFFTHNKTPTLNEILDFLTQKSLAVEITNFEIFKHANMIAQQEDIRDIYNKLMISILKSGHNYIFTGRDTFKFATGNDISFLIISDFSTRLKRKILDLYHNGSLVDILKIKENLMSHDHNDIHKLPSGLQCNFMIENQRRNIHSTIHEILTCIRRR